MARLLQKMASDPPKLYLSRAHVPRDLRTEAELRAKGFVELGEPAAVLVTADAGDRGSDSLGDAGVPLYSTARARRLRGDDWARLPRRAPGTYQVQRSTTAGEPRAPNPSGSIDPVFAGVARPPAARGQSLAADPRHWLARLFHEGFVLIDTETTGLGANDEVIEIAAIASEGTCLLESLVRPRFASIHPAAQRVHGLRGSDLRDAPTWPEVQQVLADRLAGRRVLAWNAPFDERLTMQSSRAWEVPHELPRIECAMRAYALCRGVSHGTMGLQRAAHIEGVLCGPQTHRGSDDTRLALALLRRLLARPTSTA